MLTYAENWFYLLLPKGDTYETFEAADGKDDRRKTETVIMQMKDGLPRTLKDILSIDPFEYSVDVLARIDEKLTEQVVSRWVRESDPDDQNNCFKLTRSRNYHLFRRALAP